MTKCNGIPFLVHLRTLMNALLCLYAIPTKQNARSV